MGNRRRESAGVPHSDRVWLLLDRADWPAQLAIGGVAILFPRRQCRVQVVVGNLKPGTRVMGASTFTEQVHGQGHTRLARRENEGRYPATVPVFNLSSQGRGSARLEVDDPGRPLQHPHGGIRRPSGGVRTRD